MNSNEDLIISGSNDFNVKFFEKQYNYWNLSDSVYGNGRVHALNLNENEDKLIMCNSNNQIGVLNRISNQKWNLVQTIQVNEQGYRLCFTIQNQFVFKPKASDYLEIYDFDGAKQKFYQKLKFKYKVLFQMINYFLAIKHGKLVNIFKVNQNRGYKLIKSIEYQDYSLYGRMTDDGEYLITYDFGSWEIQVRKLKFKKGLS